MLIKPHTLIKRKSGLYFIPLLLLLAFCSGCKKEEVATKSSPIPTTTPVPITYTAVPLGTTGNLLNEHSNVFADAFCGKYLISGYGITYDGGGRSDYPADTIFIIKTGDSSIVYTINNFHQNSNFINEACKYTDSLPGYYSSLNKNISKYYSFANGTYHRQLNILFPKSSKDSIYIYGEGSSCNVSFDLYLAGNKIP